MRIAAIWVGHVRTFHRIWPENVTERCWNRLGLTEPVRNFFYTYPAGQCRRNRPDDPPADYSAEDALEYVKLALDPEVLDIRDMSQASIDLYNEICKKRPDMNTGHVGTVVHQFTKRLEAWNSFKTHLPDWEEFDAIVFHRPDVEFQGLVDIKLAGLTEDELYTFDSLGPPFFHDGMDDRFAIGHPKAIDRYMRMGESVPKMLLEEKRDWWPEQNYALHCKRSGIKRLEARYVEPVNGKHLLEIVRFSKEDGKTLAQKLISTRSGAKM